MTAPSDNLHRGDGNGGVINQARTIGGWIMEPILESAKILATKSLANRQGRDSTTPSTPTNLAKGLMSRALMRTSPPQGTPRGPNIERTPKVVVPNLVQPLP